MDRHAKMRCDDPEPGKEAHINIFCLADEQIVIVVQKKRWSETQVKNIWRIKPVHRLLTVITMNMLVTVNTANVWPLYGTTNWNF